jgi:hypothetical protein
MVYKIEFEETHAINDFNVIQIDEHRLVTVDKAFVRPNHVLLNVHIKENGVMIASTDKSKGLPRITNTSLDTIANEWTNRNGKINIKRIVKISNRAVFVAT